MKIASLALGCAASGALVITGVACEQKPSRMDQLVLSAALPTEPPKDASSIVATVLEAPVVDAAAQPIPRPLPKGKWGPIQMTDPQELQEKALAYTIQMATPQPGDPVPEKEFLDQLKKKILVAVRGADKGENAFTSVAATQGGHMIEIEMGLGCNERAPFNIVAQRAGTSLGLLRNAGVFAISCHDAKWKCFQSTRDTTDVLCVAAPRR
jgi:hypothetical protein